MTLTVELIALLFIGTLLGLFKGALPGLTVTMAIVLVVSLTFGWPMEKALALIMGAYVGGVMGGSISAIALNIPGSAAAVATTFDGYKLKLQGKVEEALSIALFISFIGGLWGVGFLYVVGPIMGMFALKFGPQEYFLICVWGITLVAALSLDAMAKGFIAACIGLFVGMVGMDPITGLMRFTFGTDFLSGGINYITAMIGLFGMKEVFCQLTSKEEIGSDARYRIRDLLPKWRITKRVLPLCSWCLPIGSIIGILPGAGGDIGSLVCYGATRSIVKNPSQPFGKGAYEGVAAPEVANDASIGGDLATMLVLGIPGDSITAVILGSFYMHGLLPGPTFFLEQPAYFTMIVQLLLIGTVFAYVLGILCSNMMLRVLKVPKWYLTPCISILCIVGSYALSNRIEDVIIMLIFGIVGFVFEKAGFPLAPMVLSVILGPMIEEHFLRALINVGSVGGTILSFFTRPISLVMVFLLLFSIYTQIKLVPQMEKRYCPEDDSVKG